TNDKTFVYAIGLWGDLPYSAVQADPGVPNLIADMNASKLEFTVHDGDLKAGNGPTANPPSLNCDDTLYTPALGWLNSPEGPALCARGNSDGPAGNGPSTGALASREGPAEGRQFFAGAPTPPGTRRISREVDPGGGGPRRGGAAPAPLLRTA